MQAGLTYLGGSSRPPQPRPLLGDLQQSPGLTQPAQSARFHATGHPADDFRIDFTANLGMESE